MITRKLDRRQQFDERSRNFRLIIPKPPRSYTWRCDFHLDQGQEGACVGFGITHEFIARPKAVEGLSETTARALYKTAQMYDPWPGEDYEGTSVLAGAKVAKSLGFCESYRWTFSLQELIVGVGYSGPAVLGVPWYEGMFYPDGKHYIHAWGQEAGGHCILCKSVNLKKERFTLHNSWGTGWGYFGDCYISFPDMERLLKNGGESVFLVERHMHGSK